MKPIRFDVPDEVYDELMSLISHHGEKTHILRRALTTELKRLREDKLCVELKAQETEMRQ